MTTQVPEFDANVDYYKEYWRMYLQNENLINDVDCLAH